MSYGQNKLFSDIFGFQFIVYKYVYTHCLFNIPNIIYTLMMTKLGGGGHAVQIPRALCMKGVQRLLFIFHNFIACREKNCLIFGMQRYKHLPLLVNKTKFMIDMIFLP